jgi:hypothetical protein
MELASCHPLGAYNFEVVARFLENLHSPAFDFLHVSCSIHHQDKAVVQAAPVVFPHTALIASLSAVDKEAGILNAP